MEPNTIDQSSVANAPLPEQRSGVSPLYIGAGIVVVILLIVGGLYVFFGAAPETAEQGTPTLESQAVGLPPTSQSDAVRDIDADVSATDLDALDTQIEADLQAAESAS